MLIAVLSDVHGHLPALEAALALIAERGCQAAVFLGDAFGYLPEGPACFERLAGFCAHLASGNHEAMLAGRLPLDPDRDRVYGLGELKKNLDPALKERLLALPQRLELEWGGRRALFVHGSPAEPLTGYVHPDTPLDPAWAEGFDLIFMGHTHRPFIRDEHGARFVNVGSAGLPRGPSAGRSCLAVWDTVSGAVELMRRPLPPNPYPEVHPSVKKLLSPTES